jgi:predicted ATP-dependent serine protease
LQAVLNQGWDIVIMDSLVEVMSMVGEDLQMTTPKVERWLLNLLNQHNKGSNNLKLYTSFLCIQQKNKSGQYVGSKRLEHMTSAFLQLKWDEKERGKRYMMFSKNRNGKENIKLYYNFNDGIQYDVKKYQNELELIEKSMNFKDEDLPEVDMNSFFDELKK